MLELPWLGELAQVQWMQEGSLLRRRVSRSGLGEARARRILSKQAGEKENEAWGHRCFQPKIENQYVVLSSIAQVFK